MTAFRLAEFPATCHADAAGTPIVANPTGLALIDQSRTLLQPGTNYLIVIHKISSSPDIIVETPPEGDDYEEHS